MKRFIAVIFVALLISGCGTTKVNTTQPVVTQSQGSDSSINEQAFVLAITNEYPELAGHDAQLIELGHGACELIDSGATLDDFTGIANDAGFDVGTYGFIVGAAISAFCPENQSFIDNNGSVSS